MREETKLINNSRQWTAGSVSSISYVYAIVQLCVSEHIRQHSLCPIMHCAVLQRFHRRKNSGSVLEPNSVLNLKGLHEVTALLILTKDLFQSLLK